MADEDVVDDSAYTDLGLTPPPRNAPSVGSQAQQDVSSVLKQEAPEKPDDSAYTDLGYAPPSPNSGEVKKLSSRTEAFVNEGVKSLPHSFMSKVGDYLESRLPGVASSFGDMGSVGTVGGVVPLDAQGRPGGTPMNSDLSPEWMAKSPEDRYKDLQAAKEQAASAFTSDVDTSNHKGFGTAGEMVFGLADPTTFLAPELKGLSYFQKVHAIGKMGGGLMAANSALDYMGKNGAPKSVDDSVDFLADTAINYGLGYGMGAAVHGVAIEGISKLASIVMKKKDTGTPFTVDDVKDYAASLGDVGKTVDAVGLTGKLNAHFELNGITPEEAVLNKNVDDALGLTIHNFEAMSSEFYQGKAQEEIFRNGSLDDAGTDFSNWLKPKPKEQTLDLWNPSNTKVSSSRAPSSYTAVGEAGVPGSTLEHLPPEMVPGAGAKPGAPTGGGYTPTSRGGEVYDPHGLSSLSERTPGASRAPSSYEAVGEPGQATPGATHVPPEALPPGASKAAAGYSPVVGEGAVGEGTSHLPPEIIASPGGRLKAVPAGTHTFTTSGEVILDPYGLGALAENKPGASRAPGSYSPVTRDVPGTQGSTNRPPELLPEGAKKPSAPTKGSYTPVEPNYVDWSDPLDLYKNVGLEDFYNKSVKDKLVTPRKGKPYTKTVEVKNRPYTEMVEKGTQGPAREARTAKALDQAVTPSLDQSLAAALSEREQIYNYFNRVVYRGSPTYNQILEGALKVGKYAGDARGPDEIVTHAVANGNIPAFSDIGQELAPLLGKITEYDPNNPKWLQGMLTKYYEVAATVFHDAFRATRSVNNFGKAFAKLMTDAKAATDDFNNQFVFDYQATLKEHGIKAGSTEEKLIASVLRKTVKATDVPEGILKAARFAKKLMDGRVIEAARVGMITAEEKANLLKKGSEEGYFPRVVDNAKMGTPEGRAGFIKSAGEAFFKTEQQVKDIVESYLGEKLSKESKVRYRETQDGRVYMLPTNLLERLWQRQMLPQPNVCSVHLQLKRVIPESWEKVLEPYLHNETGAVLAKYVSDTTLAIEHARRFGADDKKLAYLLQGIEADSPHIMKQAQEAYYQQVGDFNSKNIQSFVTRTEFAKSANRAFRAINSIRLLTAPLLNPSQPLVMGLPHLASKDYYAGANLLVKNWQAGVQLARGVGGLAKGLASNFTKAGREQADRACAAQVSAMMEQLSALHEGASSVFGKSLPGGWFTPIDIILDPTKFLKANGFGATELFNRRLGYHMGKAYNEGLVADYAAALAKGDRVNPNLVKGIERRLWESGLDPVSAREGKLTIKEMDLAAKKVSDDFNFTGDDFKNPALSGTFYGKLVYQFKSYSMNSTGLIGRSIIGPAMKGNIIPLATAMGVTAGLMPLDVFYSWIMGDDHKYTLSERYLHAAMNFYGGMMIIDIVGKGLRSGEAALTGVAGPSASTTFAIGSDLAKAGGAAVGKKGVGTVHDNLLSASTRVLPAAIRNRLLKRFADDKQAMKERRDAESRLGSGGKAEKALGT